jgi:hypothetical protein
VSGEFPGERARVERWEVAMVEVYSPSGYTGLASHPDSRFVNVCEPPHDLARHDFASSNLPSPLSTVPSISCMIMDVVIGDNVEADGANCDRVHTGARPRSISRRHHVDRVNMS